MIVLPSGIDKLLFTLPPSLQNTSEEKQKKWSAILAQIVMVLSDKSSNAEALRPLLTKCSELGLTSVNVAIAEDMGKDELLKLQRGLIKAFRDVGLSISKPEGSETNVASSDAKVDSGKQAEDSGDSSSDDDSEEAPAPAAKTKDDVEEKMAEDSDSDSSSDDEEEEQKQAKAAEVKSKEDSDDSDSSSDEEEEVAAKQPPAKEESSDSDSSSDDDEEEEAKKVEKMEVEEDSDSDSSSDEEEEEAKAEKKEAAESSSDDSSDGSDDEEETKATPAATKPADDGSSSSSSDSDSDEEEQKKEEKPKPVKKTVSKPPKKKNQPFRRVRASGQNLESNSWDPSKHGGHGAEAFEKLGRHQGKEFIKAKNKRKRSNRSGFGSIDFAVRSTDLTKRRKLG